MNDTRHTYSCASNIWKSHVAHICRCAQTNISEMCSSDLHIRLRIKMHMCDVYMCDVYMCDVYMCDVFIRPTYSYIFTVWICVMCSSDILIRLRIKMYEHVWLSDVCAHELKTWLLHKKKKNAVRHVLLNAKKTCQKKNVLSPCGRVAWTPGMSLLLRHRSTYQTHMGWPRLVSSLKL